MSLKEQVVTAALLGTQHQAPSKFSAEGMLGDALALAAAQAEQAGPEKTLLNVSALLSQFERAGKKLPKFAGKLIEPALQEDKLQVSARSTIHLKSLLDSRQDLLPEWLKLAAQHQLRVPDECLVALLQFGSENRGLHPAISACTGQRAKWLSQFNSVWSYVNETGKCNFDLEEIKRSFDYGDRDERYHALLQAREVDPALGLSMMSSTWKTDSAEDRALFLGSLSIGLSMADEPFLESDGLDDKRKEVRKQAQELLLTLPESRLAKRAWNRLLNCLNISQEAGKSNFLSTLLSQKKQFRLDVHIPEACDKVMQRDGINPKGNEIAGFGEKGWRLCQIISQCYPRQLIEHFRVTGRQFYELMSASEWAQALKTGFVSAVERTRDEELAKAILLQEDASQNAENMFSLLNSELQESIFGALLESRGFLLVKEVGSYYDSKPVVLLLRMDHAWSEAFSRTMLKSVRTHLAQKNKFIFLDHIMRHIGNHLDTKVWANVEETWTSTSQYDPSLEKMISTLKFRREFREALSTKTE